MPGGPRRRRRHSWRYRLYANLDPAGHLWRASQSIAYRLRLLNPFSASASRSTVGSSGGVGSAVGVGIVVGSATRVSLVEVGGSALRAASPQESSMTSQSLKTKSSSAAAFWVAA